MEAFSSTLVLRSAHCLPFLYCLAIVWLLVMSSFLCHLLEPSAESAIYELGGTASIKKSNSVAGTNLLLPPPVLES